jgi:hypothetical protein
MPARNAEFPKGNFRDGAGEKRDWVIPNITALAKSQAMSTKCPDGLLRDHDVRFLATPTYAVAWKSDAYIAMSITVHSRPNYPPCPALRI